MIDYPFTVRPLSEDEGSGYLAEAIDLEGCMSDGETIEEAANNLQDACLLYTSDAADEPI